MIFHVTSFVAGLLLLMFPADGLLTSSVELRGFDAFRTLERDSRARPWWWVPLLWIDPFRGFVGAGLLTESLGIPSADWAVIPRAGYALALAVFGLAVVVQMLTRREKGVFLAPIFFISGIVASLVPWPVSVIGLAMALTGMFAFRQFHAFFSMGFATVCFLGFVLTAGLVWLVPALEVLGVPAIAMLLSDRELELPVHRFSRRERPKVDSLMAEPAASAGASRSR